MELPYAGTSGWSGSETSEARAKTADKDGRTRDRQQRTLQSLAWAGGHGLTWKELANATGWHHGTTSGALSVLHKAGKIARLTETRNRCKVYVLPEWILDRPTEPHGRITGTVGNPPEAMMMSERQADLLIAAQPVLVNRVAHAIEAGHGDPHTVAENVIATVANWLTQYRPADFGDDYCTPLDVTAFILRKGETLA